MKTYNFETIGTRYETGSAKWREIRDFFKEDPGDIIPFSVADMELETAPEIKEGLKAYIDQYVMGYANAPAPFLEAVCGWMKRRHDWEVRPEWIINTPGVVTAFYNAVHVYTEPGDGVLVMSPVYYPMYRSVKSQSRNLVETILVNKGGRYEIDFDDFEKKCALPEVKLLLFCSPHNPVSRVWTKEELLKVGEICLKHGVVVVSDEIHFDLIMPGYHHTVFATLPEEIAANALVMTAPSKTFNLAGLQTSNIIISNPELREKFVAGLREREVNPKCNVLGMEACRVAYENCEEWLDQVVALIDRNKKLVEDYAAEKLPELKITPMEGTYLQWLDFRAFGIPYRELAERLRKEAKLFFDDGYIFGAQGEGFERWNLACPTRYVQEAMERMEKMLRS